MDDAEATACLVVAAGVCFFVFQVLLLGLAETAVAISAPGLVVAAGLCFSLLLPVEAPVAATLASGSFPGTASVSVAAMPPLAFYC
jgi:hypothetical protein